MSHVTNGHFDWAAKIDFLRRPKLTFYRSKFYFKFYFTYPHQAGYYDPPITREKHENGI